MRVDRLLDPPCGLDLWHHPWPWAGIFKVKFSNSHLSGIGGPIDMEWKGCESDMILNPLCNLELWAQTWYDTEFVEFHGQIVKELYFRNGCTDWYETKWIWMVWPYPWPRPWIFKIEFEHLFIYLRNYFRYYFSAWQHLLIILGGGRHFRDVIKNVVASATGILVSIEQGGWCNVALNEIGNICKSHTCLHLNRTF